MTQSLPTIRTRARLLAASLPALLLACQDARGAGATADAASFTVTDELAPQEVSENTEIYLDGKLIGQIHLDRDLRSRRIAASVADGMGQHAYALCGDITVRRDDGRVETHEVNSQGVISDVDGRDFEALGASDFTFFYLADQAPDRIPTRASRSRSGLCHPPLS